MDNLSEMFVYLDELRRSGQTNMFGAAPYLVQEFGIDRSQARTILKLWMDTFSDEPPILRASKVTI